MLVNHQEIDHLLTQMSDVLRNTAYRIANTNHPKGSETYTQFFDEDGTLIGYDIDTNKALLRDALDHYVQYSREPNATERLDFANYLQESFQMVAHEIMADHHALSFLTASFSTACGILSSVLAPVMDDVTCHGQLIDKIESYAVSFENTFYLVHGEDVDNPESYDPAEDDLSTVDCDQTPEELAKIEVKRITKEAWNEATRGKTYGKVLDPSHYSKMIPNGTKEHMGINLTWNPNA
jgi:hypothetical protein